jgi:hypothetical protein
MYTPYFAKEINKFDALNHPSTVKTRNNRTFAFWERAFFERAMFSIDFDRWPEEWRGRVKDFVVFTLFRRGYALVASEPEFGTFAQPCAVSGYDFNYQPTKAVLSNPKLNKEYTIGKDCAILQLTPDYFGIWDIIERYAGLMSNLDNALDMSLINNKIAWLFGAKTKGAATALRKAFDQINRGEPLAIYDMRISDDATSKTEPFQHVDFNVKGNYITTDLLADMCTIVRNFDAEIGIPTLPYDKKERMVTDEVESRKIESQARATIWIDTINETARDVKKIFPDIDIHARLRADYMGGENDVTRNDVTTGII